MSLSRSQFVVLGATGFLGRAVVERCRRPDSMVIPLSSVDADLTAPEGGEVLAQRLSPETIVVVATRVRPDSKPIETFRREINLTLNVARALQTVPVRHCVCFSSAAVYGDLATNLAVTEATPTTPTNWYGLAKLTSENILDQACRQVRVPLLVLRPCMVYGPGDRSMAYGPPRFLHSLRQEKRITIFGDGSDRRDYLFVDDLAETAFRLIEQGCTGIFNLATGQSTSIAETVEILRGVAAETFEVTCLPRELPCADLRFDIHKLIEQIGPYAFVSMQTGLAKTVDCWYRHGTDLPV